MAALTCILGFIVLVLIYIPCLLSGLGMMPQLSAESVSKLWLAFTTGSLVYLTHILILSHLILVQAAIH